MSIFGKQCIVIAIDAKRNYNIEKDKIIFKDKDGRNFGLRSGSMGAKKEQDSMLSSGPRKSSNAVRGNYC